MVVQPGTVPLRQNRKHPAGLMRDNVLLKSTVAALTKKLEIVLEAESPEAPLNASEGAPTICPR